jgi:two-component system sensor histidine kinase RegB
VNRPRAALARVNPWHLAEDQDEGSMWLAWLVRLRWVAMVSQVITLSVSVSILDQATLTIPLLLGAVGLLGLTNLAALRTLQAQDRVGSHLLLGHLLVDVLVLTGFFLAAGGSTNPFTMLYLIHVAIGAVILPARGALTLMVVVVAANGLLHLGALPLHPERHSLPAGPLMSLGQTVAFTVTVGSIGVFLLGMAATLRRQKTRLLEARERTARTDRLRSVGTLAAGAAHEINTPLSTMGLRVRRIARRHHDADTAADVGVVMQQLDRCSTVVEQLLVGAGDPSARGLERMDLRYLVEGAVRLWSKGADQEVVLDVGDEALLVDVPPVAFTQAFTNLIQNAREAQAEVGVTTPLEVRVVRRDAFAEVRVSDRGPGLPSGASERVGEPFFTTKPSGTGLGVFVARAVAEGAGGGLRYSRDHDTTVARWWFPETGGYP